MLERMPPLAEEKPRMAPLTIRMADIPALFSEGPEPEPARAPQVRWVDFEKIRERLGVILFRRNPRPVSP